MIRVFDFLFSLLGLLIVMPFFVLIYLLSLFDTGKPIFKQTRMGMNKKAFSLYKFRTMKLGTASVASHLTSVNQITAFGKVLRRTKLDELPQLINVLNGTMSLVGPRPNLFSQEELINEREKRGVYKIKPGITGLAQINNIDMSTPKLLAETDAKMVVSLNVILYFKCIFLTIFGKGQGDAVLK